MERFVNKVRQYMELIPVLLFLVNLITYILVMVVGIDLIKSSLINEFEAIRHFFDASFVTLFVLAYVAMLDKWDLTPKVCLWALFALWLNNLPYIIFDYEPGLYFSIISIIIYSVVIIFTMIRYTNR